jgi:hypothetical protein
VAAGNFGRRAGVLGGMNAADDLESWTAETFAAVELGDKRRTRRLLKVAAALAQAPSGAVMTSILGPAEREGAFRFLANEQFTVEDLADGISASTLRRCEGLTYCPVDGASISLSDEAHSRDIGGVGPWSMRARGLHAITMLAANRCGAPVGILGPRWWVRTERSTRQQFPKRRTLPSEIAHVVTALRSVDAARRKVGGGAQLWFQLDRGFDAWQVLQLAQELELLVTVRSSSSRKIQTADGGTAYLHETVERAPKVGTYAIQIPDRPERPGREARLTIRVARVQVVLPITQRRTEIVPISAVYAAEENRAGPDRLSWILLTTADVRDYVSARAVVLGYTTRWLIEDLHRAWKRGWTNVERNQLRRRNSICKWATLHLAVAARALRLAKLARSEPDRPSTDEFSPEEIQAVLLLNKRAKAASAPQPPSLGAFVLLLAELGGHDRYSRKPPGPTVIGRALSRIASLAEGLALLKDS